MSIYNYLSFLTARNNLALRLYDAAKQFWSDAELKLYIIEALRTWNALTSYWRGDFTFQSQQGVTWYDLTDTTNLPNTLRPITNQDTDLYSILQYHLLEPVSWNPWTGNSAQFSAQDLLNAVQSRHNEAVSVSGCTQFRRTTGAVNGRITLPDTVLQVRRVAYLPAVGPNSVLWPEDTWGEQAYNRNYTIAPVGTPMTYLMSTEPPISFDTDAPPGSGGVYELLTIENALTFAIATPVKLNIPDDWSHVVKWGALYELLSHESNAKDALRAQYCLQRFNMGMKMLSHAPSLLALRIGNVPVNLDSVRDADLYNTSWQAGAQGAPSAAYYSGLNLLALATVPDAGPYSITATVVENAPLPVADTDSVQVARDDIDSVLDYAQHLAAFKMGGAEFIATIPLLQSFLQQAQEYGLELDELGEYTKAIYGLATREKAMNPRVASSDDVPMEPV